MMSSDGVSKIADELQKILDRPPSNAQSSVIPPNPACKIPRLVRNGGPEAKVFHIRPHHVEVGEIDPHINSPKYFAPFPDRITGLRAVHMEEAKQKRQVLRLRDNTSPNPINDEFQTFHYMAIVPPHPDDERCF